MAYVYVLENEAMPGLIKIGISKDVSLRMSSLFSTEVPLPFTCYYAKDISDKKAQEVEKVLHETFNMSRVHPRREFFRMEPSRVVRILKLLDGKEIGVKEDLSQEDEIALEKNATYMGGNLLKTIGVPVNATLTYTLDNNIKAKVISVDPDQIEYNNDSYSLSGLVRHLKRTKEMYYHGARYWKYKGKVLWDMRLELDELQDKKSNNKHKTNTLGNKIPLTQAGANIQAIRKRKLAELELPSGWSVPVNSWRQLIQEIGKHIYAKGVLNKSHYYIEKRKIQDETKEIAKGIHIRVAYDIPTAMKKILELLSDHGENPATYNIIFANQK